MNAATNPTEFRFTGGIAEFIKHLNRGKQVLHDTPIYIEGEARRRCEDGNRAAI